MKPRDLIFTFTLITQSVLWAGIDYPTPTRDEQKYAAHGTHYSDPYRWMEDPSASETREWIDAQRTLTTDYLSQLPQREALRTTLEKLWNYERRGAPVLSSGRAYWFSNSGLQSQALLYSADTADAPGRLVLDPNTLSGDGTVALGNWEPSPNHRYLAYSTADGGSDWQTWHVRDLNNGEDLGDRLEWSKFSGAAWNEESSGFYYCRFDAPQDGAELEQANQGMQVYYHAVGTKQADDHLIYDASENPDWILSPWVTEDGHYLILQVSSGCLAENTLLALDLKHDGDMTPITPLFKAQWSLIGSDGEILYMTTSLEAPRGRVVTLDMRSLSLRELIPQSADTLDGVAMTENHLVTKAMRDAHHVLSVHSLDGSFERELPLPAMGSVGSLSSDRSSDSIYYSFTSFVYPSSIFSCDVASGISTTFFTPDVAFDPADYTVEQRFYPSTDGCEVPMYIMRRSDTPVDGSAPTILYGYGGFNISVLPSCSMSRITWLEHGGIFAVANLRGGGEYGDAWHEAGMLHKKQTVFNDFISAAEYLIREDYTSTERLAIQGGSNGGTLIGACMNQRPNLFAVCLPHVGVMDMLRFHLFTIGWAWTTEYGTPDKAEDFAVLRGYSPYHNITPGTRYPATLVITGERDDRVVPAHSFKYAAQLQHCQAGDAPTLIRIESRAGHGAGKPTQMVIDEVADEWAFVLENMGIR